MFGFGYVADIVDRTEWSHSEGGAAPVREEAAGVTGKISSQSQQVSMSFATPSYSKHMLTS